MVIASPWPIGTLAKVAIRTMLDIGGRMPGALAWELDPGLLPMPNWRS